MLGRFLIAPYFRRTHCRICLHYIGLARLRQSKEDKNPSFPTISVVKPADLCYHTIEFRGGSALNGLPKNIRILRRDFHV